MRSFFLFLILFFTGLQMLFAQTFVTGNALQDSALRVAVWTIDHNTENSLLKAGADYGGEWTRDISMNSWNAVSLLRPDVAEFSLWSVTENRQTIGHQYWDKILWTIAAWNHFVVTGNETFLREAYYCCKRTMQQLEDTCLDAKYGLFMGPAVFQDGITAYEEPIYDTTLEFQSYVLTHPNSHTIKCLSTNCVYYEAYLCLKEMALICEPVLASSYQKKADQLKKQIRHYFYNKKEQKLYYLIDHTGKIHDFQEGLGNAFAVLFDVLTPKEQDAVLSKLYVSPSGIPSVWPSFKRHSVERPGRHNVMVWPHVCMYYAAACAHANRMDLFHDEMARITHLATQCDPKGEVNFHEIYTVDGVPSGGWQVGGFWPPLNHQTWCATGYLRNYLNVILGMQFEKEGIHFHPIGSTVGTITATDLHYRNAVLNVTIEGQGGKMVSCMINGQPAEPFVAADVVGTISVVIVLSE